MFEAVVNHFNALGKFIIVNIPVLYLTSGGLKSDFFFIRKSMVNCQTLVLLQILYLKFQNSLSEYPILTGIRIFQNGKTLSINKNISKWENMIY